MTTIAEFGTGQVLWSMIWFFLFFIWIWLLIVVFSDFTDPTSAELMIESIGRLVSRHLVLFVTMADEELEEFAAAEPASMQKLAMAVTADSLLRQRALVTRRLKQLGVDVIEAPHHLIGTRLIDAYLEIKRSGAIG